MPPTSLPKALVAGRTICNISPDGSLGNTTAILHDNLHAEPVPPMPEPLTLCGHWLHDLACGSGTNGSGLFESPDQHAGLTATPSLYALA